MKRHRSRSRSISRKNKKRSNSHSKKRSQSKSDSGRGSKNHEHEKDKEAKPKEIFNWEDLGNQKLEGPKETEEKRKKELEVRFEEASILKNIKSSLKKFIQKENNMKKQREMIVQF